MRKQQVISLIIIIIFLSALYNCGQTKSPPGLYMNKRPPFSVSYPINWKEQEPDYPNCVFRVDSPDGLSTFWFFVIPNINISIRGSANAHTEGLRRDGARDIKLIYEKKIELHDGTPAYETEFEYTVQQMKYNNFYLTVKERDTWVVIAILSAKGRINEELKRFTYTLKKRAEEKTEALNRLVRVFLIVNAVLMIAAFVFILLLRMKRSIK